MLTAVAGDVQPVHDLPVEGDGADPKNLGVAAQLRWALIHSGAHTGIDAVIQSNAVSEKTRMWCNRR
jgi:hypothetical protein